MLDPDIQLVCSKVGGTMVYSLRSLLVRFYHCQLTESTTTIHELFDAFFTFIHDARWCRRQVSCLRGGIPVEYVMWPPLSSKPSTALDVINVRNLLFVPLVPRFMDQQMIRHCFSLYGV